MVERRGGIYARLDGRANTRKSERVPAKCFVKGVPRPKIHMFEMGNKNAEYDIKVSLAVDEEVQIKHSALEAARVSANKALDEAALGNAVYMKIIPYPHHIIRENKMATGAGADRFQEGMSNAFGAPIATMARIKKGQKVLIIWAKADKLDVVKEAMRRAKMKLPVTCKVVVEEVKKRF